jgi:hypothetical protein
MIPNEEGKGEVMKVLCAALILTALCSCTSPTYEPPYTVPESNYSTEHNMTPVAIEDEIQESYDESNDEGQDVVMLQSVVGASINTFAPVEYLTTTTKIHAYRKGVDTTLLVEDGRVTEVTINASGSITQMRNLSMQYAPQDSSHITTTKIGMLGLDLPREIKEVYHSDRLSEAIGGQVFTIRYVVLSYTEVCMPQLRIGTVR